MHHRHPRHGYLVHRHTYYDRLRLAIGNGYERRLGDGYTDRNLNRHGDIDPASSNSHPHADGVTFSCQTQIRAPGCRFDVCSAPGGLWPPAGS